MAGGKLSPRQKMIGMMYLVLTALLALNVSKEILDAFVTVNNGLENTGKSFDKDINALYAKFDEKKSIDPLRVMNNWKKAQEARKLSAEMHDYIVSLKKMIVRETEGFKHKEEDTARLEFIESKDNYDVPTDLLCGTAEDGSNGQAHELRKKLDEYKKKMMALLSPELQKSIHLSIETNDPTDGGEYRTWEMKTFYHSPLAADITILSKIEDDVKAAESDVVDALLRETESDIIPFDTVAARVIASTNYVMQGEQYQADIFLAAFNKTLAPQVLIGKYDPATGKMIGAYDSVDVKNGLGRYIVDAQREGIMTYEGVINMKTPKGVMMQYPFKSEYIVARPALTVSADKMNVMYAGLTNPISVSVPGVPNEKLKVTCNNGNLRPLGNGKFEVIRPAIGKCSINVVAEMDSGKTKSMGAMEFVVKPLPKPYARVSGVNNNRPSSAQLANSPGILVSYDPSFVFQATANIVSFTYYISVPGGIGSDSPPIQGARFDGAFANKVKSLRRGSKVYIENIVAVGADGVRVQLDPIALTIQ